MANWVAPTGPGAHLLTEKQWAIITQISAKLDAAPVEDLADDPEPEFAVDGEASCRSWLLLTTSADRGCHGGLTAFFPSDLAFMTLPIRLVR
jgi:hypothetical protein